jgi:hypothetical protein
MFSTIDAEHARFVRAYLVTPTGERPLIIPAEFEKKIAELRAAPNQRELAALANELSQRNWYDAWLAQRRFSRELARTPGTIPLTGERLQSLRNTAAASALQSGDAATAVTALPGERTLIGMAFTEVRCELWKYEMPSGTSLLQGRRLFTATAEHQGANP